MDGNILFLIVLAAVYLFQYLAGRTQRDKEGLPPPQPEVRQQASSQTAGQTERPSEMGEAIDEIGRILRGEPTRPMEQSRQHAEHSDEDLFEQARDRARGTIPYRDPFQQARDQSKSTAAYRDPFGMKSSQEYVPSEPIDHTSHAHRKRKIAAKKGSVQPTAVTVRHKRSGRLIPDRQTARDAIVLAEVLGPPISKRDRRR